MRKVSLSSLFSPQEYHAPLLPFFVKRQILAKMIGYKNIFGRIVLYSSVGTMILLFFVIFMYLGNVDDSDAASGSSEENTDYWVGREVREDTLNKSSYKQDKEKSESLQGGGDAFLNLSDNVVVNDIGKEIAYISVSGSQEKSQSWWNKLWNRLIDIFSILCE